MCRRYKRSAGASSRILAANEEPLTEGRWPSLKDGGQTTAAKARISAAGRQNRNDAPSEGSGGRPPGAMTIDDFFRAVPRLRAVLSLPATLLVWWTLQRG